MEFYINTFANWKEKSLPKVLKNEKPNYISDSCSQYWYTEDGVYRLSNHWNRYVRSCSWFLNGKENRRRTVAFCKWEDFRQVEFDKDTMKVGDQLIETHVRKPFSYYKEKYNL